MMKIVLLVLWIGGYHGGPAIIEFSTMERCQAAIPTVLAAFKANTATSSAVCVEVVK